MKKTQYEQLAEEIRKSRSIVHKDYIYEPLLIEALCDILKADNPRFDENKFRSLLK